MSGIGDPAFLLLAYRCQMTAEAAIGAISDVRGVL